MRTDNLDASDYQAEQEEHHGRAEQREQSEQDRQIDSFEFVFIRAEDTSILRYPPELRVSGMIVQIDTLPEAP